MGLYVKDTIWHGEQCSWQYLQQIWLKCFMRLLQEACLGEGFSLKSCPVKVVLLRATFALKHDFYTEWFLHMD